MKVLVALIGGGDFGTEAGTSLAHAGHDITALTSEEEMMIPGILTKWHR